MADLRRNFIFPEKPHEILPEVRAANALEFIAHYLDRIDAHLESLASSAETGNGTGTKIALQLMSVAQELQSLTMRP